MHLGQNLVAVFTRASPLPILTHAEKVKMILSYELNNNRSKGSCELHKNLKEKKNKICLDLLWEEFKLGGFYNFPATGRLFCGSSLFLFVCLVFFVQQSC